jgi:hypothetical protein
MSNEPPQIAKIIPFRAPPKPPLRICSNCDHSFWNPKVGIWCEIFNDLVVDESADDCQMFENDNTYMEEE